MRFPRKHFQFRHSKICKETKISFMINPIKFVTYLKLMLKRFPKTHPMINFWLNFSLFFQKKKNVNKHKKNEVSFIVDIVSNSCTVEPLQMLFRKNSPWQILGFNSFSGFLLLFQWMIWFFSLKYLQIKWNPVKPDVLQCWKNRVWLMVGWKPYLRKLPVTDVWLDLGLTQICQGYRKNAFQRNQFTDYMT